MAVPPTCGCCPGYDDIFDARTAKRDLQRYHRKGPRAATRRLIDYVAQGEAHGLRVLDIGGGVGAVAHELVRRGASSVEAVDGSSHYLAANREEARRQGYRDRAVYRLGDFVALAHEVQEADLVTLDRVVCCYPDVRNLLRAAATRTRLRLGLVLPRDDWWVRALTACANLFLRVSGSPFRSYRHSHRLVSKILEGEGLRRTRHARGLVWQVDAYERFATPRATKPLAAEGPP